VFDSINAPHGLNWKARFLAGSLGLALAALSVWVFRMTQMPLRSYALPLPPLSGEQAGIRDRLAAHVKYLSQTIGERNLSRPGTLPATADYLRRNLEQVGYAVTEQTFQVDGQTVSNLEAILAGNASTETIVVGAHYDTAAGAPGANDNGSGVAGVLELARLLRGSKLRKTVRLVLFVNEEPPYFQTDDMGSVAYARQLRKDHIAVSAMFSLETIGYYSDVPSSQKYPALLGLFYPNRGNFVGFVANPESRELVRRAVRTFRQSANFPSEGIAAPAAWPGIGWSDQWSFWQQQFPAIMITDTAPFRYRYYHTPGDTTDHVDFDKMARVVDGIHQVVESLAMER
jgi:Zn-dependent M28 family amino/carboxypeptidase